jgi:hypothetical protein
MSPFVHFSATVRRVVGMALLLLIGNPQSQAAAEFLSKLSAEKDAAISAPNQSQQNNADTARLDAVDTSTGAAALQP